TGVMNLKVWLRTFTSAIVWAIAGMWQATQSLPALPPAWWGCCSIVPPRGPLGGIGPWQGEQTAAPRVVGTGVVGVTGSCVAAEAGHPALVHLALDEIVALHPILMRRAVGKVRERRCAGRMFLETPEVTEPSALVEPDRPVEISAFMWILEWLPLRVALDAR